MPTRVNLRPGTKVLVSGHPAVLTELGEFEFDLPDAQCVAESLQNDAHNFALNSHLMPPPLEEGAAEPWITYDEETETLIAPGFKTDISRAQKTTGAKSIASKSALKKKPIKAVKAATKKQTQKVSSKPASGKAVKTATKKGSKKR